MKQHDEAVIKQMCRLAHVKYVGIQSGFGVVPDVLLFQPGHSGTTLAIPVSEASAATIDAKVSASRKLYRDAA